MSQWEIWHNPRCSKSRQALQLLEERGIEPTVVRYLDVAPSIEHLDEVLQWLNMEPIDLIRTKDKHYKELALSEATLSREEWLAMMHRHPVIIERPVVIHNQRAVVGRPIENVLSLLE